MSAPLDLERLETLRESYLRSRQLFLAQYNPGVNQSAESLRLREVVDALADEYLTALHDSFPALLERVRKAERAISQAVELAEIAIIDQHAPRNEWDVLLGVGKDEGIQAQKGYADAKEMPDLREYLTPVLPVQQEVQPS